MKIHVTAKPNANKNEVQELDGDHFIVSVTEPPVKGRANKAILKLLSKYFGVSSTKVFMIHGHTTRQKTIEILK